MLGDEILIEIDATLDRLIQNAEVLQKVDMKELSEHEMDSFQKTQESLIHRLLHMDELLEQKRKPGAVDKRSAHFKIQEKRTRFEILKISNRSHMAEVKSRDSIFCKRRRKKLLVSL